MSTVTIIDTHTHVVSHDRDRYPMAPPADLARMASVGASAFLIGESFMRQPDVEAAVRAILVRDAAAA